MEYYKKFNPNSIITQDRLFRAKLSNGARLIGEYNPGNKLVLGAHISKGAVHDPEGKEGLHHFLEHLLFKSRTDNSRSALVRDTEDTGGEANAYTTNVETEVHCTIPKRKLDLGLNFITYLVGKPLTATPYDLGLERSVVLVEMDKYYDNPTMLIGDLVQSDSLGEFYGKSVLGSKESVESITLKEIIEKRNQGYSPENMIFSFIGDVDPLKVAEKIEESIKNNGSYVKEEMPAFNRIFQHNVYPRSGIKQATLGFSFNQYGQSNPLAQTGEILHSFLICGERSELVRKLRVEKGWIYDVIGELNQNKIYGSYELTLATKSNKVEQVTDIILESFKTAQNISKKEFERIKLRTLDEEAITEKDLEERRLILVDSEFNEGNAEEAYKLSDKIARVTHDEFVEAAHHAVRHGYSSSFIVPDN